VNTAEAAINAAAAGVGITRVLSYQVAQEIRANQLVLALEDFEPAPWPVSLVYTDQRLLPSKVRVFLDYVVPRLKATLSAGANA
jgi:Transcriptional regulator